MKLSGSLKTLVAVGLALKLSVAVLSAEEASPTVDAAMLAGFMEKWKTYSSFQVPMQEDNRPLILAALAKDPAGPWLTYLAEQADETRFQVRSLTGKARQDAAVRMLVSLEKAEQILARDHATNPSSPLAESHQQLQQTLTSFLLEAGPAHLPETRARAQKMLDQNKNTNSWNYGNVLFTANELLGRVALRENNFEAARMALRAAGKSPGSPQLYGFGPEFSLARELLEHGSKPDRECVLAFLDDIAHFWTDPPKENANAQQVALDHLKELDGWREEVRNGKIPDHTKWH